MHGSLRTEEGTQGLQFRAAAQFEEPWVQDLIVSPLSAGRYAEGSSLVKPLVEKQAKRLHLRAAIPAQG